jgi:glycosyltransferase involved in cell wall biosynthesis
MPPAPPITRDRPLKVAVLVTLERGPGAGGHVKSWERLAEAAASIPDRLTLDLHFLGERHTTDQAASNVRFHTHAARWSTRRLGLDQGAGHTDLAGFNSSLAAALTGSDVVHATDFFSFGKTAIAYVRRGQCGLTASVQTDVPRFTRIYAGDIIRRMLGRTVGGVLVDHFGLPARIAAGQQRGIDRRLVRCDRLLLSKPEDRERLSTLMPSDHIRLFRRGIDRTRFDASHRNRAALREKFGIPEDRVVLLFAGRVDDSKSAPLMAEAAKRLVDEGLDIHALVVGEGQDRSRVSKLLRDRASTPGNLPQAELAWIYASADVFVFPSTTEVSPNVVLEAKASGLPVVVAQEHGGGQFVARSGEDGVVLAARDAGSWTAAIRPLVVDPAERARIGKAARRWVEHDWPDWCEVLERDLLAAWHEAAEYGRFRHVDHTRHRTGG